MSLRRSVIRSRGFIGVTTADFVVRSAYQMGKTPLLPLFAASLGAGDILLGVIVSVSTLTGMVLKPFIGILSDRTGRRVWLLIGTAFFAGMPLAYWFIDSPGQLVTVRIIHGIATAIYGPVTLAYVAELSQSNRAERLGWFSMARNSGYIVGPAAAGVMLLTMNPVQVFTVIGLLSSLAFLPVLALPETLPTSHNRRLRLSNKGVPALIDVAKSRGVWLAGGMNAHVLIAEYTTKAFLPLYADDKGVNIAIIGAFFAVQEGVHLLMAPLGGRLSDRIGNVVTVGVGMAAMGTALLALIVAQGTLGLMGPAILIGLAQALVFPATLALASETVDERNLGAGMGLVGTLRNAAKVAGPITGGFLIYWFGLEATLLVMGAILLAASIAVLTVRRSWLRRYVLRTKIVGT